MDTFIREMKARIAALKAGAKPAPAPEPPPPPKAVAAVPAMPSIDTVASRKNKAYSRMNRLHATIRHIGDDEGRRLAALEILRLEREVQACWRVIDRHAATGELTEVDRALEPEEPPFDPAEHTIAELGRMLAVAKAYISKAAKKGYPAEKIAERESLINQINEYLKAK